MKRQKHQINFLQIRGGSPDGVSAAFSTLSVSKKTTLGATALQFFHFWQDLHSIDRTRGYSVMPSRRHSSRMLYSPRRLAGLFN